MKKIVFMLMVCFFAIGHVLAEDAAILNVRKYYTDIREALPQLKKTTVDVADYSIEGGEATAYQDENKHIRFIDVALYGESGKVLEEFYFKDNTLIFVLSKRHQYNAPVYVTQEAAEAENIDPYDANKTEIFESRYYFSGDKMIRWIDEKQKQVLLNDMEFNEMEKHYIAFAKELLALFK